MSTVLLVLLQGRQAVDMLMLPHNGMAVGGGKKESDAFFPFGSLPLSLSLCIVRRLFRLIGSCFNVLVVSAGVVAYSISFLFFF